VQKIWFSLAALTLVCGGLAYYYIDGKSRPSISVAPKAGDAPSAGSTNTRKALSSEQLERMVEQVTKQTQQDPKNSSAWAMLAHSYEMLGKFPEAASAYKRLAQLLPKDSQVLADYADALAVANGRSFKGEPVDLLKRALSLDAKNAKALLLTGAAFIETQDYTQAISFLEKARSATTDTVILHQIDGDIAQAKALSGAPTVAPIGSAQGTKDIAADLTKAQVSGRVLLTQALRAKVPDQATLFVFARPAEGSRMPVALLRKKVSDLPLDFTLNDSMAMVPGNGMSKLSSVVVVARISIKGDVVPTAGDLEIVSAPVPIGTKNLKLEITQVLK
jgi:cytochrome c-type biogenesis protein CcmH